MITAVAMWQDLAMDGWEEGGSEESESDQLWKLGRLLEVSVHLLPPETPLKSCLSKQAWQFE